MGILFRSLSDLILAAFMVVVGFVYRVVLVAIFSTAVFVLLTFGCLHIIGEESLPHIPATIAFFILLSMAFMKGL